MAGDQDTMNRKKQPKNKKKRLPIIPIPEGLTEGYLTKATSKRISKKSNPIYYFVIDDPYEHKYQAYYMPAFIENQIKGDDLLGELCCLYRNGAFISIDRVGEPIEVE